MRLISQNGNVDIPYGKAILLHAQDYVMARVDNKEYIMGEYSSMDKSYRVMEMLRNVYSGMPIIMQNVEVTDEVMEMLKKQNVIYAKLPEEKSNIEYVNNSIFVFPKDEDVEV